MINEADIKTELNALVRKGIEARSAEDWALSARYFEAAYTLSRDPIWRDWAIEMDEENLTERAKKVQDGIERIIKRCCMSRTTRSRILPNS